ncbi:MAG TPA: MFS transporter [Actinocrinis sp.]|uniref:MFS transporter n=1 Tax=Actinocrinis sp. TaxID=1920516 RepID=UPI002DDD6EB0|nr:MFS transporter [Actinocrinis sp.]HEV2345913.1 MFS transporter [Actinocrinis sp.]
MVEKSAGPRTPGTADSARQEALPDAGSSATAESDGSAHEAHEASEASKAPAGVKPSVVLAVVSAGVILSGIDLFIVNVALPQIAKSLRVADLSNLSWLLNAYTVAFAALLVPLGRLADRSSRMWGFILGIGLFTAASALCAAAGNLPMLIAFRAVQGAGAALLTPTSLGLLLAAYPAQRRAGAVRVWTAIGGVAAIFGPTVGGLLVELSWRWVFLVNLPIGIVAIAAGIRLLPRGQGDASSWPDVVGTLLLSLSIGSLVLALVDGNQWHWGSARVVGLLIASAVLLALFVLSSTRHPSPVVEMSLLRVPQTAAALISTLLFSTAFGAMIFSLVLLAENTWGWSALRGGLAATPNAVLVLPASVIAGIVMARRGIGAAAVITAGCVLFAGGVLWWSIGVPTQPQYVPHLLIGLLLTGLGVGLAMPTLFGAATSALPAHRFATGSGVVSMVRQVGLALGVAILVAVLDTGASGHVGISALRHGWIVTAAIAFAAPSPLLLVRGQQQVG